MTKMKKKLKNFLIGFDFSEEETNIGSQDEQEKQGC